MANTEPGERQRRGDAASSSSARAVAAGARVYPDRRAVASGSQGERLAEIGEMHRAGIVAVSDDGRPVMDAALMRRALEYTRMFDLPVIAHEEDAHLAAGGVHERGRRPRSASACAACRRRPRR